MANQQIQPAASSKTDSFDKRIDSIRHLSKSISSKMNNSLRKIDDINMRVRLLSFNAQIQAAKAGEAGRTFAVVANEIGNLSTNTAQVAEGLAEETKNDIAQLSEISSFLSVVRGGRLVDLALTNIDLIDRNLYERSCDVRWWATDSSAVLAFTNSGPDSSRHACERLGVILNAYTVYYDIVLCDLNGTVIANGRPEKYKSIGMSVAANEWFRKARNSASGDDFGFETVHPSPLVQGQHILAYSCGVRREGQANGELIGVLGILFNWEALAQTIVQRTPLSPSEKDTTRVCIIDTTGNILADTKNAILKERIDISHLESILLQGKGFTISEHHGAPTLFAVATAPGYETYSTGWHSIIIQTLNS
jgi:Methyl-accepting chemotaxis protein (MCP) signalling domain